MKGIQSMSLATGTSKRFHAENLYAEILTVKNVNVMDKIEDLMKIVNEQQQKIQELEEKLNSIAIEEN